jgi:hypothetical protein
MKPATLLFGLVFWAGAALSLLAGTLVVASLFIVDRSPASTISLHVHLAVGGVFLALSLALFGIRAQLVSLANMIAAGDPPASRRLEQRFFRLLLLLGGAGTGLCGILAILAYAILARIDEGFAVFG